jgi:hypothetical protein
MGRLLKKHEIVPGKSKGGSMNDDLGIFLVSIAVLILYLVFSAMTEMGTKWPWRK